MSIRYYSLHSAAKVRKNPNNHPCSDFLCVNPVISVVNPVSSSVIPSSVIPSYPFAIPSSTVIPSYPFSIPSTVIPSYPFSIPSYPFPISSSTVPIRLSRSLSEECVPSISCGRSSLSIPQSGHRLVGGGLFFPPFFCNFAGFFKNELWQKLQKKTPSTTTKASVRVR